MRAIIFSFFLIMVGVLFSSMFSVPKKGQELHITISSSFTWSKKVWGTYKLTNETTSAYNVDSTNNSLTKISSIKTNRPIGNLIFKKGRMFILRPIINEQITNLLVKDFPYKKLKQVISVTFDQRENDLFDLYGEKINQIISASDQLSNEYYPIDSNSISFHEMLCTRKPNRIECRLPIMIKKQPRYKS